MKNIQRTIQTLRLGAGLALALVVLALGTVVQGATQYATGGITWDNASSPAWGSATGGPYTLTWSSGNDAVLEGTAGTVTIAGPTVENITFNTTSYILSGASTLTLGGTTPTWFLGSGISATIGNNTATVLGGGAISLTKAGLGTVTLSSTAVSTFTGGLNVNGGTLTEDFSKMTSGYANLIDAGNVLTLGGGTLTLNGKGSQVTSQTFASTTLNSGGAVVTLTQNSATSLTAALGTITRNAGATLGFSVVPSTSGVIATTTTGIEASGILGPWAAVGATTALQYATTNASGQIVSYGLATTTAQPANLSDVNNAAVNYAFGATTFPTLSGAITAHTLRYTGATAGILGANGFSITLDGLMNAGGASLTTSNKLFSPSDLIIGASKELVILANAQSTTISNRIVDNGAGASSLVYSGAGSTLTLSYGTNTYSGGTVINSGSLSTAATGNTTDTYLGTGLVTVNPGATLALNKTYLPNNLTLNNATVTAGNSFGSTLPAGYTITLNGISTISVSGNLTIAGNMTGSGGLIKANITIGLPVIGNNSYTGPTTITAGGLEFMPQALYGANTVSWTPANITVASAAVLGLFFSDAGTLNGYADFNSTQVNTLLGNLTTGTYNNGLRGGSIIAFDTSHGNGTYSGVIADSTGTGGGSIGVNKLNANTLTLSGNNTFTGPVTVGPSGTPGGTLKVYSFNSINGGTPPLANSSLGRPTTVVNGTITLGNASNNQSVGLTYLGTGETTDRVLAMNAGVAGNTGLTLDQSGNGLLKFTSAIANNGISKVLVLQGSTAGTGELAGGMPNPDGTHYLSVTKSGTGTWVLSGANTYAPVASAGGITTINGGCLVLSNATALPGGIGVSGGVSPLTFNGGVLGLGAGDFSRNLAAAGTGNSATFTGAGGWAAFGTNRVVNLGGASALITWATAGTGFNAQTLLLGTSNATHTVDFQNPVDLGTAARTVRVDDGAAAVDAMISGNLTGSAGGNLSKTGLGTLALTGNNNYVGTTTVSAGTLLINGSNTGTGLITVSSGATNGGTGTIAGAVTYATGAKALFTVTPDPISSLTNLTPLTITGTMTYNANQVLLNAPANLPSGTYILAASTVVATASGAFPTPALLTGSYAPGVSGATVSLDGSGMNLILTVTGNPTTPTQLAITSVNGGTSPTAQVGFPVVVQAQDANGAPRLVSTDTAVQLNKKVGSYLLYGTLTGTIPGGSSSGTISGVKYLSADTGVVLTATNGPSGSLLSGDSAPFNVLANTAPNYLTVTDFPSPQTAGVAGSVTVTCKTLSGSTATTYAGTVHFSSTAVSAGLPANYTFVPATDNGVHVFTGVTLNTAGTQSITATDTVTPSITGTESGITVNPAAASALAVSGFPSPQGTGVAGSVTVTALDAYGNTVPTYAGTIQFTSNDGSAVLPANYTFVGGDLGTHTFNNGVTLVTLGTAQTITATDTLTSSITGAQSGITVWVPAIAFAWTNSAGGNWNTAVNWTNESGLTYAPVTNGQPNYTLSFGPGTYAATHNLADGFLLNQLNFAGAVTLNSPAGSPRGLTFTNDGLTQPQITHRGSGTVAVNNPLSLGTNLTIAITNSSGTLGLYGAVSGVGTLIKTNAGTLNVYIVNSYSGGTIVNGGTLQLLTGGLNNALGFGAITLNSGTTFGPNGGTFTNAITLNGATVQNGNSSPGNFTGPVTLSGNSTFDISGNMNVAGNMSGPSGLIKTSGGPLNLSGTNSHTGTNFVLAGVLQFNSTNAVGSAGLSIVYPGKANLNYPLNDDRVIPALWLDGAPQALGIYGSSASAAGSLSGGVVDNAHFSGTGTVSIRPSLPPLTTPPGLDPNYFTILSGVPNLTFTTIAGYYYRIVYSDNTAPAGASYMSNPPWSPVVNTPTTDANGWVRATTTFLNLIDPAGATAAAQRFYRIEGSATPTP